MNLKWRQTPGYREEPRKRIVAFFTTSKGVMLILIRPSIVPAGSSYFTTGWGVRGVAPKQGGTVASGAQTFMIVRPESAVAGRYGKRHLNTPPVATCATILYLGLASHRRSSARAPSYFLASAVTKRYSPALVTLPDAFDTTHRKSVRLSLRVVDGISYAA